MGKAPVEPQQGAQHAVMQPQGAQQGAVHHKTKPPAGCEPDAIKLFVGASPACRCGPAMQSFARAAASRTVSVALRRCGDAAGRCACTAGLYERALGGWRRLAGGQHPSVPGRGAAAAPVGDGRWAAALRVGGPPLPWAGPRPSSLLLPQQPVSLSLRCGRRQRLRQRRALLQCRACAGPAAALHARAQPQQPQQRRKPPCAATLTSAGCAATIRSLATNPLGPPTPPPDTLRPAPPHTSPHPPPQARSASWCC
jgi:hypothetical protein